MDFQTDDSLYMERFGPDLTGGHWEISGDSRHVIVSYLGGEKEVLKILKLTKDSLRLLNISSKSEIKLKVLSR